MGKAMINDIFPINMTMKNQQLKNTTVNHHTKPARVSSWQTLKFAELRNYPLVNCHLWWIFPWNMMIFHSYVSHYQKLYPMENIPASVSWYTYLYIYTYIHIYHHISTYLLYLYIYIYILRIYNYIYIIVYICTNISWNGPIYWQTIDIGFFLWYPNHHSGLPQCPSRRTKVVAREGPEPTSWRRKKWSKTWVLHRGKR